MKKLKTVDLEKIKNASERLSLLTERERNLFLENLAKILKEKKTDIVLVNKQDVERAKKAGLPDVLIERLRLDETGIKTIVTRINAIKKLKSGLGKIIEERVTEEGLLLQKVSVPLGVIFVIYEARPEVAIDVTAVCIKSGNAVILKGGSEANKTNKELCACIQQSLKKSGLSKEAVSLISDKGELSNLLKHHEGIDLVVARGGYKLVNWVKRFSTIPILAHGAGGARIYVDKSANLQMAKAVIVNAKTNRPATCNSLDTLVVHEDVAKTFLTEIYGDLNSRGVEVRGDTQTRGIIKAVVAKETDWKTEYLDKILAVKIVSSAEAAVDFIQKYSKKHSEGVIAKDQRVIDLFTSTIDASALFVNCSTRLHDGYIFGMGAEMGIATGKLHARGPVGLRELTTHKWVMYGTGQVRT